MTATLEVVGLTVRFGGLLAVDDVSLVVEGGMVVGLIGPNGAGKTTCIDAIGGFVEGRGRVSLDSTALEELPPHERARRGLARTFQSLELFDDLTVAENLSVAAQRSPWWGPLADAVAPTRPAAVDVDWALASVGLTGEGNRRPDELANGPRHLVALARAIVGHPQVVLLDEPGAGLDAVETAALSASVRQLADNGLGVLLVDHDMDLVLGVCDTVVVLDLGRVIATGTPAEVRADAGVITAYLGDT